MPKQLELFPDEEPKEEAPKVDLNPLFDRLAKSKFRSSFYLNAKDKEYIREKGWDKIEQGAREIISKRLAPAYIPNDGKQTPMRHGIFSTVHCPARYWLLLPQLLAEVARDRERQTIDAERARLYRASTHEVAAQTLLIKWYSK